MGTLRAAVTVLARKDPPQGKDQEGHADQQEEEGKHADLAFTFLAALGGAALGGACACLLVVGRGGSGSSWRCTAALGAAAVGASCIGAVHQKGSRLRLGGAGAACGGVIGRGKAAARAVLVQRIIRIELPAVGRAAWRLALYPIIVLIHTAIIADCLQTLNKGRKKSDIILQVVLSQEKSRGKGANACFISSWWSRRSRRTRAIS